ncbi:MAG: TlpA disulfide reductase family protein [Bryobacteraceae bacterium]
MRFLAGLILACSLQAAAPIPRPAPEFKIHEPSGKQTLLSAQKGKVTVVQFLFTWCQHCQATAQWLSKMQTELGPKGLEVYGVAFNDEILTKDTAANNKLVTAFSQYASFPVGIVKTKEPVLSFLGLSVLEAYGVPQLVVIDRKGVIRAQTPPRPGAGSIVEEKVMRELVTKLLAEK